MAMICKKILNLPLINVSRSIYTSTRLAANIEQEFELAKEKSNSLKEDPGNDIKLQMYALFKQATVGQCNAPKPGMMDLVGKVKWNAWNNLGDLRKEEAQKKYIEIIQNLVKAETDTSVGTSESKYKELKVTVADGVCTIMFNRPSKKNAINVQMYNEIKQALEESGKDKSVVLTVTTGAGDYYCSGNDLSTFAQIPPDNIATFAKDAGELLKGFVAAFIDFPKPLVALVNGPAVGVSVTVMGLYDAVFASDKATFHTPFSTLGQTPEGCSTYTLPKIIGPSKANSMLLFNHKMTAQEGFQLNFVTEVFPDHVFLKEAEAKIKQFALLPKKTLWESKILIRSAEKSILHQINNQECQKLVEMWQGEDCKNAIMNFFQRKSKL